MPIDIEVCENEFPENRHWVKKENFNNVSHDNVIR